MPRNSNACALRHPALPPAAWFAKRHRANFVYNGALFSTPDRAGRRHASPPPQALPPPASSTPERVNNRQPFPPAARFAKRRGGDFVYNGQAFTPPAYVAATFSNRASSSQTLPSASSAPERVDNGQPLLPAAWFAKYHRANFVYNGQAFTPPAYVAATFSNRASSGQALPSASSAPERVDNGQPFRPAAWFAKRHRANFVYNGTLFSTPDRAGSPHASPPSRHSQKSRRRNATSAGQALPPPASSTPERVNNDPAFPPAIRFAKCHRANCVYNGQAFTPLARVTALFNSPGRAGGSRALPPPASSTPERVKNRQPFPPAAWFAKRHGSDFVYNGALFSTPDRAGRRHASPRPQALPPPASSTPERVNNRQPFPPAAWFAKRRSSDFVYNGEAFAQPARPTATFSNPDRAGSSRALPPPASSAPERVNNRQPFPPAAWFAKRHRANFVCNGQAFTPPACSGDSSSNPDRAGSSQALPPPASSTPERVNNRQPFPPAAWFAKPRGSDFVYNGALFSNPGRAGSSRALPPPASSTPERVNNGQPFPPAAWVAKRRGSDFVYNGHAFTLPARPTATFSNPGRAGSSRALPPPASSTPERVNNRQPFPPAAWFAKRRGGDFVYNGQAFTLPACSGDSSSNLGRAGSSQALPPPASSAPERVNNRQPFPPAAWFAKRRGSDFVYNGALFSTPDRAGRRHASPPPQALPPPASSTPERVNNRPPFPPAAWFAKRRGSEFVYNGEAFAPPARPTSTFSNLDRAGSSRALPPPASSAPERVNNGQPFPPAARFAKHEADFVYNRPALPPVAFISPERRGSHAFPTRQHSAQSHRHSTTTRPAHPLFARVSKRPGAQAIAPPIRLSRTPKPGATFRPEPQP